MARRRRYSSVADLPAVIPIFPLTGVLLLPRARLPLNVFEKRYLALVDAAMDSHRLIGMIQPKIAGQDAAPKPELSDAGCVGRIVEYSETDDGRYLITLAGVARFRVAGERVARTPFRQVAADYEPYADDMNAADDMLVPRDRLLTALKPYLKEREMKTDWDSIQGAPAETLINALSMMCPFEPRDKQALLEAQGLKDRAEALIALIEIANASSLTGSGKQPIH
jgi:Lon protease-like protein